MRVETLVENIGGVVVHQYWLILQLPPRANRNDNNESNDINTNIGEMAPQGGSDHAMEMIIKKRSGLSQADTSARQTTLKHHPLQRGIPN